MDLSELPNLRDGVEVSSIKDGAIVAGRIDSEKALLVRSGKEYFAVGAERTHHHGALAAGLTVAETVRCPLHHACFSLRTGAALRAPALDPIACWRENRSAAKCSSGSDCPNRSLPQRRLRRPLRHCPRR